MVDGKAETVATTLERSHGFALGVPEENHSDQERQLESALFKELCQICVADYTN